MVIVAAEPVVFWLPVALTPGKLISAEPLNDTPPIFLAVARVVDVAEFPVVSWLPVVLTPGKLISAEPLKATPPILREVVRVAADPVMLSEVRASVPVDVGKVTVTFPEYAE